MMGELAKYSATTAIISVLLYIVYRFVMADRNQHSLNRTMIIAIYTVSMLYLPIRGIYTSLTQIRQTVATSALATDAIEMGPITSEAVATPVWPAVISGICVAGMLIAGIITATTWMRILFMIWKGRRIRENGYTIVLIDNNRISPFSWMKYIVMSENDYSDYGNMILAHERNHIRLNHWLDLMLAQIFVIFQWYNPVSYLLRKEMMKVHEYQVDNKVIENGFDRKEYQIMLIKKAVGKSFPALANSLNHSNLKKRITMMMKSKSDRRCRLQALAMMPAIAAAIALVNLPLLSHALETVGQAEWPQEVSETKITKIIQNDEIAGKVMSITPAVTSSGRIAVTPADNSTEVAEKNSITSNDDEQQTNNTKVFVNGQEMPRIILNGKEITSEELHKIAPDLIASMKVDKSNGENKIYITLKEDQEKKVATAAEKIAEFPGGQKELMQWLVENVRYPEDALVSEKPQRVIVQFTVEADGSIADPKIMKGIAPAFDNEALRLINSMPKWIPATTDGKNIATKFTLPITFKAKKSTATESKNN